jgi:hypothetical protein
MLSDDTNIPSNLSQHLMLTRNPLVMIDIPAAIRHSIRGVLKFSHIFHICIWGREQRNAKSDWKQPLTQLL